MNKEEHEKFIADLKEAADEAVRKAIEEHWRAGHKVWIIRDGVSGHYGPPEDYVWAEDEEQQDD